MYGAWNKPIGSCRAQQQDVYSTLKSNQVYFFVLGSGYGTPEQRKQLSLNFNIYRDFIANAKHWFLFYLIIDLLERRGGGAPFNTVFSQSTVSCKNWLDIGKSKG